MSDRESAFQWPRLWPSKGAVPNSWIASAKSCNLPSKIWVYKATGGCVCGPFLFLTIRRIYSNTNHATGSLCSKLKSVQCMYDICLYFVVGRSALALVAFSWTSHTSVMSKLLLTYDWSLEQAVQTRPWHRWCNANLLYVLGRVHSLPPCSESS